MGDWFMTVAAGLEYLYGKPAKAPVSDSDSDDQDSDDDTDREHSDNGDADSDDGHDGNGRHEAGEDWLAEQGFDRKD
jgi:hypothetical protein